MRPGHCSTTPAEDHPRTGAVRGADRTSPGRGAVGRTASGDRPREGSR
ncbi:hypothetical protein JOE68_005817 [Saccharothrix algeriensis]|uniref:Uncharacterized protein n=1 Tax=Saccharothrix algeriensis TaxID=173560 RepID=A0ABS2SFA5_9PSEU|nr:hypothetical protein [Saccharothrix algeriensis]